MRFKTALLPVLSVLISLGTLNAQGTIDHSINRNRTRLEKIRREIETLKSKLRQSRQKAHGLQEQLALMDEELALIEQAKGLLLNQQKLLERRSRHNRQALIDTRKKLKRLREMYAQRARYMYKYGRVRELDMLLSSESFNQALVRLRYLNRLAEYDEKMIRGIVRKEAQIERLQKQLNADLVAKRESVRQKQQQEARYKTRRDERNRLLAQLEKDARYYNRQIGLKEKERQKLLGLISRLEEERKASQNNKRETEERPVVIDFDDFRKGRGKLPWPVKGRIVSAYGRDYDPKTKTYVTNSGIEISSPIGTPVKSVFRGVVRLITYMSGYGNTIIIDHGHGYYTVYSHLGEIYVQKDDVVESNQIIALIGDSGSLAGSKLHFEVYTGQKTDNPRRWLR